MNDLMKAMTNLMNLTTTHLKGWTATKSKNWTVTTGLMSTKTTDLKPKTTTGLNLTTVMTSTPMIRTTRLNLISMKIQMTTTATAN